MAILYGQCFVSASVVNDVLVFLNLSGQSFSYFCETAFVHEILQHRLIN